MAPEDAAASHAAGSAYFTRPATPLAASATLLQLCYRRKRKLYTTTLGFGGAAISSWRPDMAKKILHPDH
jgi:hypothetical protein